MTQLSAEAEYLFRHPVVREAAYQLYLPGDRAALHGLALQLIEGFLGEGTPRVAGQMADHARFAQDASLPDAERERLQRAELSWCEVALKQAQGRYDSAAVLDYARRIEASPAASPAGRAQAMYDTGSAQEALGRWSESEDAYRRLADYARKNRLPNLHAHAVYSLAHLASALGDIAECDARMDEYLEFAAKLDPVDYANARCALAVMRFHRGEVARARRILEEALPVVRKHGNYRSAANHTFHLGILLQETGELPAAERAYNEAIRIAQENDDPVIEGRVLGSYGSLKRVLGDYDGAIEFTRRAIELANATGNRRGAVMQLGNLGVVLQQTGRLREALDCYTRALETARELGLPENIAFSLTGVGQTQFALGQLAPATESMREAIGYWQKVEDVTWQAYTMVSYAQALRLTVKAGEGRQQATAALKLLEGVGSLSDEFRAHGELGHICLAEGNVPGAQEQLATLRMILERIGGQSNEGARKDLALLERAIEAHQNGEALVRGTRREDLSEPLRRALKVAP